ncbi:MAG: TRZ/ATZ family hydrolase [Gammaproteobacteria bacterium]|nr:TRZ/ATZ family hydrolase [Gammaproteobacteria bacterium]
MQRCDTLIQARWCIPVEPDRLVLERQGIAVTDGRIVAIEPLRAMHDRFDPGVVVDRPSHLLIPGLINAHTHAAMTLFRGLAEELPLERWLREGIWPHEKKWVSAEMVRDGSKHAIVEMLKGGVTCFSDQYFFPEVVAESAIDLHMRAMIGTPMMDFATPWAENADEYLSKATDLVHDPYADHPLVSSCFAPHSTDALSDDSGRKLRILADQLDRRVQIHLHETTTEITNTMKERGTRPLTRLTELGLVNSSLMAVHAVHMTHEEMRQFSAVGVSVTHCPGSNLKLASGIAPVQAMLDAGINVALGTDGAASNNVLDMLGEMRTAALLGKVQAQDAAAIPASTALRMATLNGAKALGLDDNIGSIETGKSADLTCIDLNRINSQPVYDPTAQLVYSCNREQISDVWIGGRHLLDNGSLTHVDEDEILQRSVEWQQRIAAV